MVVRAMDIGSICDDDVLFENETLDAACYLKFLMDRGMAIEGMHSCYLMIMLGLIVIFQLPSELRKRILSVGFDLLIAPM